MADDGRIRGGRMTPCGLGGGVSCAHGAAVACYRRTCCAPAPRRRCVIWLTSCGAEPGGTNTSTAPPPPPPPPRHTHEGAYTDLSEQALTALEAEMHGGPHAHGGADEGDGGHAPSAPAHPPPPKVLSPGNFSPRLAKGANGSFGGKSPGWGEDAMDLGPGSM